MALDDITKLIDSGKEKGYLTYNEVNDLISHDVDSPEAVPTENSIALKKREQHLERERIPRSQKALVESPSCERRAVSAPGAEDHRRGVYVYIKEEAMAQAARRSYRW